MARYGPDHKPRVRERILRAAGRRFRSHGFRGTDIDALMADAGLTRGGFYAHFPSKLALFTEVLREDHGLLRMLRRRRGASREALSVEARKILADYLDPAHWPRPANGCSLATLASEATRGSRASRRALDHVVEELVHELRRGLPDADDAPGRARAALALAIGAASITRGLSAREVAAPVLEAAGVEVERLLGGESKGSPSTPAKSR